jgi:transcriptional regulator with XRE-family HTH domain
MRNDDVRQVIKDLVEAMVRVSGLSATKLAIAAGVAPSTVTRFLNQPTKHVLSTLTLAKLSGASGVPLPPALSNAEAKMPDLQKLRAAYLVAEDVVGSRELPDRAAVIAEIAADFYDVLAECENAGRPVINDENALFLARTILRRRRNLRGQD